MQMTIVSNNSISKEVYLGNRKMNVYDFGNLIKSDIESKGTKISKMNFVRSEPDEDVLKKYNLDILTYNNICNKLELEIQSILF